MTIIYKSKTKKSKVNYSKYPEGVSVITCTNRLGYMEHVFNNFLRQNFKDKELIVILNNNKMDLNSWKDKAKGHNNIKIFQLDENTSLADCKNFGVKNSNLRYIAVFDDDDYYAPNYLSKSIEYFDKVDADIIGKSSFYIYFKERKILALFAPWNEFNYVNHVADPSMIIKREVFEKLDFPNAPHAQDAMLQKNCIKMGFKIYSIDKYNFVYQRHNDPNAPHDWQVEDAKLLTGCKIIKTDVEDFIPYITK